ncbi:MAG: glycosyltransferase family 9 protein [Desulfobulbaceae bacterium]|nr:glycosyltransferase family 9 protein [Desulfobulbaceae bacterium]
MDLAGKRILIVKPSSLGDIIHTLPIVHCLKRSFPDCHLGWIVQEVFAAIVERDPDVDIVYPITIPSTSDPRAGRWAYYHALRATVKTAAALRRTFRNKPYDLILDLHASFRSGVLAVTNPGGIRIGFGDARELNPWFQHKKVKVPRPAMHAVDKNLLFCARMGCSASSADFCLHSSEDDRLAVDDFLQQQGVVPGDKIVYVNPAARWKTKFWLAERWAELADRLVEQDGLQVVFAGSEGDLPYITAIAGYMKQLPLVAAGSLGLGGAAALLQRSAVYAGLDSGPMHMAAMAGIPVVVLFGPTNPELVGPYGVAHQIIRATDVDCLGCRKRHCDHLSCMQGISVRQVIDAVFSLVPDAIAGGVH